MDGYLILSFPNCTHPFSVFAQVFLDLPPFFGSRYRSFHVRDYTYRIVRLLLQAHGFEVLRRYGVQMPWLPDWTHIITRILPRFGLSTIVVARKKKNPNRRMLESGQVIANVRSLERFLRSMKDG